MFRRTVGVVLTSATLAVAAPVPKAPPPPTPKTGATIQLATAKVSGEFIQVSQTVTVTSYISVQEVVIQNGQNVTITKAVPQTQQVEQTYQMTLKGTKASTADGKEIGEDDLAKKLGDGAAVVQVPMGFDPEWRKLFADDIVFLEPNLNNRVPGGFGAIGGPVARPLPPPPPPIVEKK